MFIDWYPQHLLSFDPRLCYHYICPSPSVIDQSFLPELRRLNENSFERWYNYHCPLMKHQIRNRGKNYYPRNRVYSFSESASTNFGL
uniref:Uncharacterized protein n=1 Tax=Nelumbo nucifera TaxID=4432 RepID=A0A822Z2K0_NELNU|nr:TPA_asm: hypothetical protein HUJ06_008306 [Nelumbo nucifera]